MATPLIRCVWLLMEEANPVGNDLSSIAMQQ